MKLLFGPYIRENPYQKQLIDQLETLGIEVKGIHEISFKETLLGSWKPNVFHLHWLHAFFFADNYLLAWMRLAIFIVKIFIFKLFGVKIIWTAHNINNHEKKFFLADRCCTYYVAKMADAIIVHTQAAQEKLIEKIAVENKQKIFIVPCGNYLDFYPNDIDQKTARIKLGLAANELISLFIGTVRPYKGVIELIEKFQQLTNNNLRLIIAGTPMNEEFSQQIKSKIEDDRTIKFIPDYIPDSEIQVYLNACDAMVFPYQDIFTSSSILLAMSFQKPCIVPRIGCIAEVLDDRGAFLYNPDSEDGLLQALNNAIKQQDRLSTMGNHNLQLATNYNWKEIANTTFNVYQSTLK